ncbi:MAG: dephospho-CoA kinase [Opitutia bacterium]|nr:MAG: dephospho-CoA kinase [Opitutae bacterium]
MVIGLTGGIGCGKSAAAACFAEFGFNVVEADLLARQVLASPGCVRQLRERWGDACVGRDGLPDRRWIAAKVFAYPAEMAFLEGLTHPEVARLHQQAVTDSRRHHIVEIPLLYEKNLTPGFALIACVACSEETRRGRLLKKGLAGDEITRRIDAQMPLSEKVKRADVVFWNDGELPFLREQIAAFVGRLPAP